MYIYEIENQMQNHKIKTNSELIDEYGSIGSILIFIKIIGSERYTVIPITTVRGPLRILVIEKFSREFYFHELH